MVNRGKELNFIINKKKNYVWEKFIIFFSRKVCMHLKRLIKNYPVGSRPGILYGLCKFRVATGPQIPCKPRICLIFGQMTLNDLEKYFLPGFFFFQILQKFQNHYDYNSACIAL